MTKVNKLKIGSTNKIVQKSNTKIIKPNIDISYELRIIYLMVSMDKKKDLILKYINNLVNKLGSAK